MIGFIGEARANKGFNKIPDLINLLNKEGDDYNFIIQFSNVDNETKKTADTLLELSKNNKKINIINKYCDFKDYRDILKNITLMPLMYDTNHMNVTNSGIIYSCISHEIIPLIPSNCDYLKKILTTNSYMESDRIGDFVKNIKHIIDNYDLFLNNAKKSSDNLCKIIDNGSMVSNIYNS